MVAVELDVVPAQVQQSVSSCTRVIRHDRTAAGLDVSGQPVARHLANVESPRMDQADEIWNRATVGGGDTPREGDVALAASLAFHGLAMNGGVLHAFEVLSAEELGRARDGFTWLAMPEVAQFIEDTAR